MSHSYILKCVNNDLIKYESCIDDFYNEYKIALNLINIGKFDSHYFQIQKIYAMENLVKELRQIQCEEFSN